MMLLYTISLPTREGTGFSFESYSRISLRSCRCRRLISSHDTTQNDVIVERSELLRARSAMEAKAVPDLGKQRLDIDLRLSWANLKQAQTKWHISGGGGSDTAKTFMQIVE